MKTFFKYSILTAFVLCLLTYLTLIFGISALVNTNSFDKFIENYICTKTGINTNIENLKLKVSPNLNFEIKAAGFETPEALELNNINISGDLKNLSVKSISAENIFADGKALKKIIPQSKKNEKEFSINADKIPEINIKNVVYINDDTKIRVKDLFYKNKSGKFSSAVRTPFLQNELKADGEFEVSNSALFAKNIKITLAGSALNLNGQLTGKNNEYDLYVKGKDLPLNEIETALLFYQKSQDPAKKFIENFTNYKGKIDVDLNIKNSGIFGLCTAKNLSAKAVWFNIPLYFKNAVFEFKGKTITSNADGLLGGEAVNHTLNINHLGSPDKEVTGELKTTLHRGFKYVPDLTILNSADAQVTYKIKNKIIDVEYSLNLNKGSDLLYKKAYLGLRDKERRFFFATRKEGNKLSLTNYDYSIKENGALKNIILGSGLFIKKNGHFQPQYMTCKTNGHAPVSVTGSFGEFVDGGEFSGDLKYDFIKNQVSGNFELINTKFKNFIVSRAAITTDNQKIYIKADGTYENENFFCDIDARNNFEKDLLVYRMNMFLNEFTFPKSEKKQEHTDFSQKSTEIATKIKDSDITIEDWEIRIGKIIKDRIVIKNIVLFGNLKNNIFKFTMPQVAFADGKLTAQGKYNFLNDKSEADFEAKNINSNAAADIIFNLQNQVNGIADAKFRINTADKFQDIKACVDFEIKEGFLPQLGSTEFMIKKSKIKVASLTNVDLTRKKALQSDIKGSFFADNSILKDINLTSKQQYLSMFIEGKYDIDNQYADLSLYGKYNKEAPKGVKVLFIPLNWILKAVFRPENSYEIYKSKLAKIPQIDASTANQAYFRVKLSGDLNRGKLDLELRGIK